MSIDDISRPIPFPVDHWRAVLHDAVDEVLDEILDAAGYEWSEDDVYLDDECVEEDEPPGDPPSDAEIAALGTQPRAELAAAIVDGTRFWGCDGTLRVTGEWSARHRLLAERVLGQFRRTGVGCDCAVLHTVLGRTDVRLRCLLRGPCARP